MPGIELDDRAFQRGLQAALADYVQLADLEARKTAERIAARARRIVHHAPIEPGQEHIADTIEVNRLDRQLVEIRVANDHALPVEFGTSKMSPRPYLRPAIQEEISQ